MTATTELSAAPIRHPLASRILWFVVRLPGFTIALAGLGKVSWASAHWTRLFASWGYPSWFSMVVGAIEVTGGVLVFTPGKTRYGALLLAATMLGAFLTLFTHRGGQQGWGATPLVNFVWLAALAIAQWRRRS
jgi:uncharacterized membrane protein YphA (DoxX/SURF4 family)